MCVVELSPGKAGEENHGHAKSGEFHGACNRLAEKVAQEHIQKCEHYQDDQQKRTRAAYPLDGGGSLFKHGDGRPQQVLQGRGGRCLGVHHVTPQSNKEKKGAA